MARASAKPPAPRKPRVSKAGQSRKTASKTPKNDEDPKIYKSAEFVYDSDDDDVVRTEPKQTTFNSPQTDGAGDDRPVPFWQKKKAQAIKRKAARQSDAGPKSKQSRARSGSTSSEGPVPIWKKYRDEGRKKNAEKWATLNAANSAADKHSHAEDASAHSDSDDAFEPTKPARKAVRLMSTDSTSDSEEKAKAKKVKCRVYEPISHDFLRPMFVSQAPPASSDPANLRGEIWLKLKQPEPVPPKTTAMPPPTRPLAPTTANQAMSPPRERDKAPLKSVSSIPFPRPVTIDSSPPLPAQSIIRADTFRRPFAMVSKSMNGKENTPVAARPAFKDFQTGSSTIRATESSVRKPSNGLPSITKPDSAQALSRTTSDTASIDVADELADLPSDAFSDDEDEFSVAPQALQTVSKPSAQGGLSTGYRQMTLHGSFSAPQDGQAVTARKTAWPLSDRQEKPTHHQLNADAMTTWVYPTNLGTIRDYQFNVVSTGLYHNSLVALPTGLGKTFIAATIMLNWYRWTKDAQIVFVAPTKPLVAQQVEACLQTVGIPRSAAAMLTGTISPAVRAEAWANKRIFFMTPQTMSNDLRTGICDPKRLVLLVVDEAHRATGNYAYVDIVRFLQRFNTSFRVLALTATPGSKLETVQQVIDGLNISRIEIRTEDSLDIRQYVHERETETFKFDYSSEQEMIMDLFSKTVKPVLDKLNSQNACWIKDPVKITAYGLTTAQRQWATSEAGRSAAWPVKTMVFTSFKILASLAHSLSLLKFHGIEPFFSKLAAFKREVDEGETKSKAARDIRQNEHFMKMHNYIQGWIKNPDFIGHPKLEFLREVILNHFLDAGEGNRAKNEPCKTRVMVFAQYRDSAEHISRVLKRNAPMIRPHVFVGQSQAEGSAGMNQKMQLEVIEQFKAGTYNTLIATSIGEEGLDIGEVDLIICFDANASPIRMLQRMGRTGRKRRGKIVLLLMKDKEEQDFAKAKDNYEKMQGMIASGQHFTFHDDKSPRILPKDVKPVVDKRVVEIPIENSQVELPEPTKPGRKKKRPPKRFNMPDGVITGFVKASRVRGDGSDMEIDGDEDLDPPSKAGRKPVDKSSKFAPPPPEPEALPLPFLQDVLLNKMQERELARKYQYVTSTDGAAYICAPMPEKNLDGFRNPGPECLVKHSRLTAAIATTLSRMQDVDPATMERWQQEWRQEDVIDDPLLLAPVESAAHPQEKEQYFVDLDDDLPDLPDLPAPAALAATRGRGRPRKTAPAETTAKKPPARAAKPKDAKPKAKPRARQAHPPRSSAMEGDESSPPSTPREFAMPSQAETLGSADTSGDEAQDPEAWRQDSDLEDFVAASDDPIVWATSSAGVLDLVDPLTQIARGDFDDEEEEDDELPDPAAAGARGANNRRRKRVVASDSDDD